MPYDNTNTLLIKAVPADKRAERGPVLRGTIDIDPEALRAAGWDGETPLKVSLWLREGVDRHGEDYRFWSGPIEVDEWAQERSGGSAPARKPAGPSRRSAARPAGPQEDNWNDDIPF